MTKRTINPLVLILIGFQVLLILYMIDQRREVQTMQASLRAMQKRVEMVEEGQYTLSYVNSQGKVRLIRMWRIENGRFTAHIRSDPYNEK